jgi:hypothetical protein
MVLVKQCVKVVMTAMPFIFVAIKKNLALYSITQNKAQVQKYSKLVWRDKKSYYTINLQQ